MFNYVSLLYSAIYNLKIKKNCFKELNIFEDTQKKCRVVLVLNFIFIFIKLLFQKELNFVKKNLKELNPSFKGFFDKFR